jgi:hypothetical protein
MFPLHLVLDNKHLTMLAAKFSLLKLLEKHFMKKFILSMIFLFTCIAHAYELNGTASDEGGGNYSVQLQNNNGHAYDGDATDNGDGTLDVRVQDSQGESYSGIATDNGGNSYSLDLQNDSSGNSADGTLEIDN